MEIKITTKQILKVLQILSWIIFIGLCIEAGGIAVTTTITLFINPAAVKNYWDWSGYLSGLYKTDHGHFIVIAVIMIIVAVLKAIMFYFIVKLFTEKTLNISQPFSSKLRRFILMLSYLALGIGLFSLYGSNYTAWLTGQGVPAADLQTLHIGGADVWLFMAVILFVIVQIVKRGIEIQTENDLTI
jgi:ABC-type multidrug transport system fused ATPase/permease subunit